MPNQEPRSPVTLEQLLRLKRAERPEPQFWSQFERELRQKQLAALLERRPWWQEIPHFLSRRLYLPVGATAVLAFTLISIKYYGPSPLAQADGPATGFEVASTPGELSPADSARPVAVADRDEAPNDLAIDDRTAVASVAPPLSEGIPDASLTPWSPAQSEAGQSRRSLAATFAQLEIAPAESDLTETIPAATRVRDNARPVELATVAAISSRRSRLLAELNERRFEPEPQAPEIVRERLARRLADQDFGDRFSRVGLKGDQVSLKF